MILYGFWRSTATWRVRIALAHKELEHVYRPVNLRRGGGEQNEEAYRAKNPMRQVPVLELEDGGRLLHLSQSLAILEYLEERWPKPALLPEGRIERAAARQIAEMINAGIQPLQNTSVQLYVRDVLAADDAAWIGHWVTRGLAAVESVVAGLAGKYAIGDRLSIADACIVPELYFVRRFGIDVAAYPTLARVAAECERLPAFQRAHAEAQPDRE